MSVDSIFTDFTDSTITSTPIIQTYNAVLPDGKEVAIKVQRPDIDRIIEVDFEIMLHVATHIERHLKELGIVLPEESSKRIGNLQFASFDEGKIVISKIKEQMTINRIFRRLLNAQLRGMTVEDIMGPEVITKPFSFRKRKAFTEKKTGLKRFFD